MRLFLAAIVLAGGLGWAQDDKGWLGAVFAPNKCLALRPGEFVVKRKLCRIQYNITLQDEMFLITGTLYFNKQFVPTRPKRVELEVLFMDTQFVCQRQISLEKPVTEVPVTFSVITGRSGKTQYVRTYYTLYYQ